MKKARGSIWSIVVELNMKMKKKLMKNLQRTNVLSDVHARTLEDRVPIFFNEHGQPIGPIEKAYDEFSKFLGTIAHEHSWVPLIYTNWHKVLDKDKMWDIMEMILKDGSTDLANRDGQAPSKRMMFEETRKRKDGCSYKKSYDDTLDKIIFWSSIPSISKSSCYEGR
ncbi:hypothetical protein Cgig2_028447 [Carnegiea gigantea]|uniref:Uncharacterized protein n=1 Tax=Carnegiea gigantea TaxID=171969 RepID=A0A9Q1KMS3_9CARY|nr:hypothetical protein Cgig2_028447 [Carnegiea gigantea]